MRKNKPFLDMVYFAESSFFVIIKILWKETGRDFEKGRITMNGTFSGDTIAAISTPVAAGGIGMVRMSGPQAFEIADQIFVSVSHKTVSETGGYHGLFGRLHDEQGEIDEAVVFVYRTPRSYTGEDVVEICCHGGIYLVQRTLRACISAGARPAQAGEFTRRAFLNGKMSLTQAEAVVDLIASQGQQSAQAALSAKDGAVFQKIHRVVDKMLGVSAALAAWIVIRTRILMRYPVRT